MYSPPPLHTPELPSPFPTLRAQWNIIHQWLITADTIATRGSDLDWLNNLDRSVLLTALAKKRAEVDLLKSEARVANPQPNVYALERKDSSHSTYERGEKYGSHDTYGRYASHDNDLRLPDYNAGFPSPRSDVATTGRRSPRSDVATAGRSERRIRRHEGLVRIRGGDDPSTSTSTSTSTETRQHQTRNHRLAIDIYNSDSDRDRGQDRDTHRNSEERYDELSPLSPSFGPRRGDFLSGTVERRRSMPVYDGLFPHEQDYGSYLAGTTHELERARHGIPEEKNFASVSKDWEKRIQFEAAWKEIERNLDAYVGKFASAGGEGRWGRANVDVWEDLVELNIECERLERGVGRPARIGYF